MKVVVLWEEELPFVDTIHTERQDLQAALAGQFEVVFASADQIAAELKDRSVVLLTVHGSTFPKEAWTAIYSFLEEGGSWVNLGGSPLSRPARLNSDGSRYIEATQTAYTKELFINQAFPIDLEQVGIDLDSEDGEDGQSGSCEWNPEVREASAEVVLPKMKRVWSLQVRFTDTKDYPLEHGSGGTRDATLRPLCTLCDDQQRRLAAPIVMIERLRGLFAGGRWLLVNAELTETLDPNLLRNLVATACDGAVELDIQLAFACFYPGEQPAATVRIKAHKLTGPATLRWNVTAPAGEGVQSGKIECLLAETPWYRHIPLSEAGSLEPGLYRWTAELVLQDGRKLRTTVSGFWVYDEALISSGSPLTLNRDYFERDGEPYPVMGTTYMSGDRHRKFLFEPNCAIWDRDFSEMKAAGVNMIRTGLWTAFQRAMLDPGAVDEGVLRAFTAFLLTARKYDIPVIFNFFAFTPEEWNGANPYLDPRAVSAQQELVGAFAHRFRQVNDLIWDFINEPSFCSPPRTWSTRPNYDRWEQAAWARWLHARADSFSPEERSAADPADVWRERWRLTPNTPLGLPELRDFQDQQIFQGTHPIRVLDYRLFAQDRFNGWVQALSKAIRSNGNPHQLITVGQDEGGIGERPNPHFFADVVDFTTNHSWWQNDDLLWDSVMTKTPNKPNLIQETGIMFGENVDGSYRRSPEECAHLLARKLVLAFAAGCAGAIQWLWNTNVYMDSDNEVGIGFLRADGTEKPELQVFRDIAAFTWKHRHRMVGREPAEVAIVIPHSNLFSVRNLADPATRRAIRVMETELGVPTRTVSEYRIEHIGDPKLILLPSPHVLTQSCWEALLSKVEAGATLLVTGPIDRDEYWRPVTRLNRLDSGLETQIRPVTGHDDLIIEPFPIPWHPLAFRGEKIHRVDKAVLFGERIEKSIEVDLNLPESQLSWRLIEIPHGKGTVQYFRFPAELSESGGETLMRLYQLACERAGVTRYDEAEASPDFWCSPVHFKEVDYYLILGETELGGARRFKWGETDLQFMVCDGDDASIQIVDRTTGEVIDGYPLPDKQGE